MFYLFLDLYIFMFLVCKAVIYNLLYKYFLRATPPLNTLIYNLHTIVRIFSNTALSYFILHLHPELHSQFGWLLPSSDLTHAF